LCAIVANVGVRPCFFVSFSSRKRKSIFLIKKFMRITILLLFISTFCFAQTQLQLNDSTKKAFQQADKKLNQVYQQIVKDYSTDTLFVKNLKASQKIWISFRDAEMKMKYPLKESEYYSMQPLCWFSYMQELTETRIATLEEWLEPFEEGDVCVGSIMAR
jgi:uncharacterized protein YecT (DUF1311 family)